MTFFLYAFVDVKDSLTDSFGILLFPVCVLEASFVAPTHSAHLF